MSVDPSKHPITRNFTLSDHLAVDRTILANERTILAYGRTFLAMLVIGGSCFKFFDTLSMRLVGAAFIAGSVVVAVIGWRRFTRTRRFLAAALQRHTGAPDHPLHEQMSESEDGGDSGG